MRVSALGLICTALLTLAALRADDWSQWRGPQRNGVAAKSPKLISELPPDGLPPAWVVRDIPAAGWGSPVLADGRVYLMSHTRKRKPDSELPPRQFPELTAEQKSEMSPEDVEAHEKSRAEEERSRRKQDELMENFYCLDAENGNQIWKQSIPSLHTSMPHSNTLAVSGAKILVLGAGLRARCLSTESGNVQWLKTLPGEFNDEQIDSSFAVEGDVAVILAGKLMALDLKTGEMLWSAEKSSGRHSSPVLWKTLVIANVGGGATAAFDLKTGEERWQVESQATMSTPVISGDRMVTQGNTPQAGLRCFRVSADSAEPLWTAERVSDKGSSPVIVGDHVFAQAEKKLVCVNLQTGKPEWQARLNLSNPQYTSLLAADNKLFYTHDGVLCVDATGSKHTVLFAAKMNHQGVLADEETHRRRLHLNELEAQDGGSEKARQEYEREVLSQGPLDCASPAFADGRLFVRLKNGLVCYDLRQIETAAKE